MKTRTLILTVILMLIVFAFMGSGARQSRPSVITGKEKRERWIPATYNDDWLVLTLPGMDDVLVVTEKYHTIQYGQKIESDIDIFYGYCI